jgi:ABC-type dipeptide/oligopeptide/nickel transport system permease component
MLSYIIQRLLLMIPTLIGITIVVFLTMAVTPGGLSTSLEQMTGNMRPEQRQAVEQYLRERYGLDEPLPVQYLNWLNQISPIGTWSNPETRGIGITLYQNDQDQAVQLGFKVPNMGNSFLRNRRVSGLLADALPVTILLNVLALPLIYLVSISSGVYAAQFRGRWFDVTSSVGLLGLWSIPQIWAGVMLIGFLASEQYVNWFPTGGLQSTGADAMAFLPYWTEQGFQRGWLLDRLWHLVLPVTCLVYVSLAFLAKLMRASVLENLSSDFVRTARAKGVSEHDVLWRHVLRNSLLPLITIAATLVPALLAGSLIVEEIFSLEGMGRLMVYSIKQQDREVVMSVTFVMSLLTLSSLILRDVCYAIADPRVTFD